MMPINWLILVLVLVPAPGPRPSAIGTPPRMDPPVRAHHTMVYDVARRQIVLAGGSTSADGGETSVIYDDLWTFDGTWRSRGTSGARRAAMPMAYDTKRARVLAYGGFCPCAPDHNGVYADLLELRDDRWVKIADFPSTPLGDPRLAYDSRRDRLVMFGGRAAGQRVSTTWEFDGARWIAIDAPGPPSWRDVGLAYDESRGRTVLFGSFGASPDALVAQTWEYDGSSWRRLDVDGPAPRQSAVLVYDSKRRTVIMHGAGPDTWAWNGLAWRKLADEGPPRRLLTALAYDAARDRVVLFGGRPGMPRPDWNDTWEWDGQRWSRVVQARESAEAANEASPRLVRDSCQRREPEIAFVSPKRPRLQRESRRACR